VRQLDIRIVCPSSRANRCGKCHTLYLEHDIPSATASGRDRSDGDRPLNSS
jgi:hypothetical protein